MKDNDLLGKIEYLFLKGTKDARIAHILRCSEYPHMTRRAVQRLRLTLELRLLRSVRWFSDYELEKQHRLLQEMVRDELGKGAIAAYGKRNLYTHFQKLGVRRDVVVLRGELFKVVREQAPAE